MEVAWKGSASFPPLLQLLVSFPPLEEPPVLTFRKDALNRSESRNSRQYRKLNEPICRQGNPCSLLLWVIWKERYLTIPTSSSNTYLPYVHIGEVNIIIAWWRPIGIFVLKFCELIKQDIFESNEVGNSWKRLIIEWLIKRRALAFLFIILWLL